MKKPQPVHATPAERARVLMELVPALTPEIEILLREHQSALFSRHGGNALISRRAARRLLNHILYRRIKILIMGYNYAIPQK
jgi:hypothetical protein